MLPLLLDASGVTNPAFIAALATFITAVAGLIKLLQAEDQRKGQGVKLDTISQATNGTLDSLQKTIEALRVSQATLEELAARATKAAPEPPEK